MPRPRIRRRLRFRPNTFYYKPQGIPLTALKEVVLERDELEALKLYQVDDNDQIKCAELMGISQPTFARIYSRAIKKISKAIIEGYAIKIDG